MKATGERYFPDLANTAILPYEPFITYEHWHRYRYAVPYCAGKVVLDIASGEGYGGALLAEHAAEVHGVDLSEEAVEHARRAYPRANLQFSAGPASAIPIPGEHRFDVVVSFETIEHLDEPSQDLFLREVRRLLKPDGVFLVSTPNRKEDAPPPGEGNPFHLHELSRDEVAEFLHRHFRQVRLLSQQVYPVSYIWGLEDERSPIAEYQIAGSDGKFHFGEGDGKETSYLIAVCADREADAVAPDSLLVDLSKTAFRGGPQTFKWHSTSLYLDSGLGYRPEEVVHEMVEYGPAFEVTFTPESPVPVSRVRWDPLRSRLCRVRIDEVTWSDGEGRVHSLAPALVSGNAPAGADGSFAFECIDPMLDLPLEGTLAGLTIRGECWVEDEAASILGLERTLRAQIEENSRVHLNVEAQARHIGDLDRHIVGLGQHVTNLEQALKEHRRVLDVTEAVVVQRGHEIWAARGQVFVLEQQVAARAEAIGILERSNAVREAELAAMGAKFEGSERELQATRERLSARDHELAGCRATLEATAEGLRRSEETLGQVLTSRRWVYASRVRGAAVFLPRALRCALARVRGAAPTAAPGSHLGRFTGRREARAAQPTRRGD